MPDVLPNTVRDQLSILYSFPHAIGAPGIGWTAWNQVIELIALGHDVHVVATSVARPIIGAASIVTTMQLGGRRVPHRAIGRDRTFAWHDAVAARRVVRLRPDVVHAWPLASVRTFLAARKLMIPALREVPNTHTANAYEVVGDEYALLGLAMPPKASHSYNASHLQAEQSEYDAATALLVPSEAVRQTFLDRGFAPSRLLRHQYGYRPATAEPFQQSRDTGTAFTAIFIGRGEPRKGLHYALAAWIASRASEGGRFLIYGDLLPEYRSLLEPLLSHPSVEIRGFTADPTKALAEADVMVLPTVEEGSALTTYEAQAVGCVPLVSTAAGAVVKHGVHGLLHEPRSVVTLTEHFDRLSGDSALLAELRLGAIAHSSELTWAAAAVRVIEAYREASLLIEEPSSAIAN